MENVVTMVEEASNLALIGASASGVEVRFSFDPRAMRVLADRIQIEQVLVNLMRNAIEAMAESTRREFVVTAALGDAETVEIGSPTAGRALPKRWPVTSSNPSLRQSLMAWVSASRSAAR
jgi:two-component system sensor kinase FixL